MRNAPLAIQIAEIGIFIALSSIQNDVFSFQFSRNWGARNAWFLPEARKRVSV
jgi:hypothetical protein